MFLVEYYNSRKLNILLMLNKSLIDPKDLEIAKLKLAIEKFKKYDSERKQYYSKSLQRLGELESYVQELESNSVIPSLKGKIEQQKKELAYLNRVITANKYHLFNDDYVLVCAVTVNEALEKNKSLYKEVKNLRQTIKDLICQLNKKNNG